MGSQQVLSPTDTAHRVRSLSSGIRSTSTEHRVRKLYYDETRFVQTCSMITSSSSASSSSSAASAASSSATSAAAASSAAFPLGDGRSSSASGSASSAAALAAYTTTIQFNLDSSEWDGIHYDACSLPNSHLFFIRFQNVKASTITHDNKH